MLAQRGSGELVIGLAVHEKQMSQPAIWRGDSWGISRCDWFLILLLL